LNSWEPESWWFPDLGNLEVYTPKEKKRKNRIHHNCYYLHSTKQIPDLLWFEITNSNSTSLAGIMKWPRRSPCFRYVGFGKVVRHKALWRTLLHADRPMNLQTFHHILVTKLTSHLFLNFLFQKHKRNAGMNIDYNNILDTDLHSQATSPAKLSLMPLVHRSSCAWSLHL